MEEFYEAERVRLERHRARMLQSYPLWDVLTEFQSVAHQLNLHYCDFIDNPTGTHLRIMRIHLTKLTDLWLKICEANILGEPDHDQPSTGQLHQPHGPN